MINEDFETRSKKGIAAQKALNIRIVDNVEGFAALAEAWNRLAEHLPPMNGFEWQFKWWRRKSEGKSLRILVAEGDRGVEGIAPLVIRKVRAFRFIPVRRLEFLGGYITDYLDFLIRPGPNREETFRSLFVNMRKMPGVGELSLNQMNSSYPLHDLWQKYSRREGWDLVRYRECPRLCLAPFAEFEAYFQQLKKNHKNSLKLRRNQLNREFPDHEFIFKDEITEADLAVVTRLNIERQRQLYEKGDQGRFSFFAAADTRGFIDDFFCRDERRRKLIAYLVINGAVASYILFLRDEKTLFFWNTAFDPKFGRISPTKLLIQESIKHAFAQGYQYFDFMRGKDSYKYDWTNEIQYCCSLFVTRSAASKAFQVLRKLKPDGLVAKFTKSRSEALFEDRPPRSTDHP